MSEELFLKSKFFAQYWGQMVLSDGQEIGGCVGDCEEEFFLVLKSVDEIRNNEDDALMVSKIFNTPLSDSDIETHLYYGKNFGSGEAYTTYAPVTDYLRSKGYALPWMGYSVEKQVELGWVKLQKS